MQTIFGIVGAVLVLAGFWMGSKDYRRAMFFTLGGCLLTGYSIAIGSSVFAILLALFTLHSLVRLSTRGKRK